VRTPWTSSGFNRRTSAFGRFGDDETLLGIGALRRLTSDHAEVKSMHTAQFVRRRGVGTAMLKHIIAVAQTRRCSRLYLETGSSDYFKPARALYGSHGFVECAPFADYVLDPNSVFMSLDLQRLAGSRERQSAKLKNDELNALSP
jgi:putative acetyltransferase